MTASRRSFLAWAGGTGVLGWSSRRADASPVPRDSVLLLATYLVGTDRHAGPRVAQSLWEGEVLRLRREPDNDYDRRAVSVWTEYDEKLGYVPRVDNQALANLMDADRRIVARVQTVRPGARPYIGLRIELV